MYRQHFKFIKKSKLFNYVSICFNRIRLVVGTEAVRPFTSSTRGLRLHRYYLEYFLQQFAADIRGHCLEFQEDTYTTRFGNSAVQLLDILHVDDSNPKATIVADVTKRNNIQSDLFDCIICTQVLHLIYDLKKAISELHRILKPNGVLLLTVPHISMNEPRFGEFWRFTPLSLSSLLESAFGKENVQVFAYGNSLTAAGCLRGLLSHEFTKAELNHQDPRYALEICARATKNQHTFGEK